MRIAIIVISYLLWLWFLGYTFTWKFGKVLLVEGTGLNSIEFAALLRDKFNRINITAGFLQSLPLSDCQKSPEPSKSGNK